MNLYRRMILGTALCAACAGWTGITIGATLVYTDKTVNGVRSMTIRDIIISEGELVETRPPGYPNGARYYLFRVYQGMKSVACGSATNAGQIPRCNGPQVPPCSTAADGVAAVRSLIGQTLDITKFNGQTPTKWQFQCGSPTSVFSTTSYNLSAAPVPVSCTSTSTEIRMQGRVGDNLTDSANVIIHCDSEADTKLTIPNDGRVSVGGEGEVQLKFPRTGSAVRYVTGTDTLVVINAELTKSPNTAGTYQGSTFLLLDVL